MSNYRGVAAGILVPTYTNDFYFWSLHNLLVTKLKRYPGIIVAQTYR